MIIALAGRRVDAVNSKEQRFSSNRENVEIVRKRIHSLLQSHGAVVLVSSAACGADLLALLEASSLGIRRRVVLPFDRKKFRETSVTDRPGEWGSLYDRVLSEVEENGDLVVMRPTSEDTAYAEANHVILDEALSLGQQLKQPVIAVLVWDGRSRGPGDLTEEFGHYARTKSVTIVEIMTL
jgi:hypothetical protein